AVANGRIADGLARVARAAERQGVAGGLEAGNHLQGGFNHTAGEGAGRGGRGGSPGVREKVGQVHLQTEERSLLGAIREHGPRARHFHLCETNGGPFGGGNLDFPAVLAALAEARYAHFVSVKVYRKLDWEGAARGAAEFLRGCGVR